MAGGTLLVHHKGETVFHEGFGYADIKSKKPFPSDAPVVIASISKPVVGTTLYRLMELGKLDVADPVAKHLPKMKKATLESGEPLVRSPTITELLTHTAGLRFDSAPKGRIWFQDWVRDQTLEYVVDRVITEFPSKAQPGTKFAYSGIGTDIAARIGEISTGLPRNEMLTTYLSKPLEMEHTFFRDSVGIDRLDREMPTRYRIDKKSGEFTIYKGRDIAPKNRYSSSGGTVVSTAPDLLRWLQMIRNGGRHNDEVYLSEKNISAMLTKHKIGPNARGGLFVREEDAGGKPTRYGHTGSSGTNIWIDLEHDVIGIMLTQTSGRDIKAFRIELEKRVMKTCQ